MADNFTDAKVRRQYEVLVAPVRMCHSVLVRFFDNQRIKGSASFGFDEPQILATWEFECFTPEARFQVCFWRNTKTEAVFGCPRK